MISADIAKSGRISRGTLAYLSQRAMNNCYDFVMRKFLASGMTKAELARRLGKSPDNVSHLLASPRNWSVQTIAELLAAIDEEEFIPNAHKLAGRPPKNITQADLLFPAARPPSMVVRFNQHLNPVADSSAKVLVMHP
jgi:hypothetical protein